MNTKAPRKMPELQIDDIDSTSLLRTLPTLVTRIRERLDHYPDGRVMTTHKLAEQMGVGSNRIREFSTHPALASYRIRVGVPVYWGNKKTVTEYVEARTPSQ
jgi:hypothetical protein